MTVNELFGIWLHHENPNADCKIWDAGEGEYIFSIQHPILNQNIEKVAQMEVRCFYCYYDKDTDTETLIINVGEYK